MPTRQCTTGIATYLRFVCIGRGARRPLVAGETTMKLIEGFDSNYRYILVAARRARQLQGGAPPVIDTHSRKPCRIAQDEIKAGKVKWVIPEIPKAAVDIAAEMLDNSVEEYTLGLSCEGLHDSSS